MFEFNISGVLKLEEFLEATPDITRVAVSLAMNDVLSGVGLARLRKAVAAEVNFPSGYVDDKIQFGRKATPTRLVASVYGRQRPTSLARFAQGGTVGGRGGVSVRVKKSTTHMPSAFLMRLKRGASLTDDNFNLGLAIRLKPGMQLNRRKDLGDYINLGSNIAMLYGPSVDQILRNEAAEAETPEIIDAVATEFFRQFARLA